VAAFAEMMPNRDVHMYWVPLVLALKLDSPFYTFKLLFLVATAHAISSMHSYQGMLE
jgi:hypothetical protein